MTALLTQALFHSLWQITALSALLWAALRLIPNQNSGVRYILALTSLYAVPALFITTCFFLSRPETPIAAATLRETSAIEYSTFVLWLWLAGGLVHGFRLFKSAAELRQLLTSPMQAAPEAIHSRFSALLEQITIGRKVSLFISERVSGACAAAFLKPIILLPPAYITQLSVDEVEAIIAHELAHIKRHDGLHRLLQTLVEIVFYFHPCLRWISRHVSIEREHACDDLAVSLLADKYHLATGLLKAKMVQADDALLLAAHSHSYSALETRVKRLIPLAPGRATHRRRILTPVILTLVLTVISASALVLPSWTSAADNHAPDFSRAQLVSLKNDVCDHLGERELYWTPPYNRSGAATLRVDGDTVFMNGSELPAEDQTALNVIFDHHGLSSYGNVRLRYFGDDVKLIVSGKQGENSAPYVYLTRSGNDSVDTFRLSKSQQFQGGRALASSAVAR